MVTGGLETVLVGNPVDGDDDAIGSGERVRSLGDGADILGFRSNLFLAAALGNFGAILTLETLEKCSVMQILQLLASNYVNLRK